MTVNAITDTKKGEQGLRLLIFILPDTCSITSGILLWKDAVAGVLSAD